MSSVELNLDFAKFGRPLHVFSDLALAHVILSYREHGLFRFLLWLAHLLDQRGRSLNILSAALR